MNKELIKAIVIIPGSVLVFIPGTILRLFLVAALVFLQAAPELHASVLRRGTNDELPTFDPQYVVGNSAGAIMYDLFEGLVTRAPDGAIAPAIAESWSVSENGTVYTFRLKGNAKWSDGRAITAGDFVYSYRRMLDPQSGTRGASALFPVRNATSISLGEKPVESLGVKAVDPLTLEFTLEGPAPYFVSLLASYSNAPVPAHVIESFGRKWTQPGTMVTNGAYMLEEVVTNTYYRLVRNPHYHSVDAISIDEVIYYPVPSPTTSLKRYLAGELDVILNIPFNQYENLRKTRPEEFVIARGIGLGYLSINNTLPPFDDVRVRKALSLAIDREVIVEKLLKTGDEPAYFRGPHGNLGKRRRTSGLQRAIARAAPGGSAKPAQGGRLQRPQPAQVHVPVLPRGKGPPPGGGLSLDVAAGRSGGGTGDRGHAGPDEESGVP